MQINKERVFGLFDKTLKPETVNEVLMFGDIYYNRFFNDIYGEELISDLYRKMRNPRYSRVTLLTILAYIKYLIKNTNVNEDDEIYFEHIEFDGDEDWANKVVDEIKADNCIADNLKECIIDIIEYGKNIEMTFDW